MTAKCLQDRVALVFGAGSCAPGWGNGKATAAIFAREGAQVFCVDRNGAAAKETVDIITSSINKKSPIDIAFLDFSKAFDKVSHRRLVSKLELLGINGNLLRWISAFLSNREQRVVLGGYTSSWIPVRSGVPQGSVLGPTLFIAFINDLPLVIKNLCKLYADDLKIIASVDPKLDNFSLQLDLDAVSEWCSMSRMYLNTLKCKIMHIGKNNRRQVYTLPINASTRTPLSVTNEERDLGVIITPDMKFSVQASHAASKANSLLGMLKHTFMSRDVVTWTTLYRTYVRPHIEFAISAWNPFLKKDAMTLEKVQRRATKIPTSLKGLDYEERLTRMNLTTLELRRVRGDLIQMFKVLNGLERFDWFTGLRCAPLTQTRSCNNNTV